MAEETCSACDKPVAAQENGDVVCVNIACEDHATADLITSCCLAEPDGTGLVCSHCATPINGGESEPLPSLVSMADALASEAEASLGRYVERGGYLAVAVEDYRRARKTVPTSHPCMVCGVADAGHTCCPPVDQSPPITRAEAEAKARGDTPLAPPLPTFDFPHEPTKEVLAEQEDSRSISEHAMGRRWSFDEHGPGACTDHDERTFFFTDHRTDDVAFALVDCDMDRAREVYEAMNAQEDRADLLAALERARDGAEHHPACHDSSGPACDCWKAQVRAAIAKARGGIR